MPRTRTMGSLGPFWAIAEADLKSLFRSRITYGWVLVAVFIQVVRTLGASGVGTTSSVVASGLSGNSISPTARSTCIRTAL